MKKKLIVFDLDGTLLNTIADLGASTNYALKQLGYPEHPIDAYRFFVGNGINKLFERALPDTDRNETNVLRVRAQFIPYYNCHKSDATRPYPGIPELLERLQRNGVMIGVASNKYQEATESLIPLYFPQIRFVAVFGQRDGVGRKPDPTIVRDIQKVANADNDETFYVGDSGIDMQTALNAGVTACGVTWGFRPIEELEALHPHHIVDHPQEILPLVL